MTDHFFHDEFSFFCYSPTYPSQGVTPVALKKLKNEEHVREFEKEAGILQFVDDFFSYLIFRSLSNYNIVQFFGIYRDAQDKYIVTEYLSKGSLTDLFSSDERTSVTLVDLLSMYCCIRKFLIVLGHVMPLLACCIYKSKRLFTLT